MLIRLADLGIRFPRRVLALAALVLAAAATFGAPVAADLSAGGFDDPHSASSRASSVLQTTFDAGDTNLLLQVSSPAGVDSPAARARGLAIVDELERRPHVSQVASYWTAAPQRAAGLRSDDRRSALVVARVEGDDSTAPQRAGEAITGLTGSRDGVTVQAGGLAIAFDQVNKTVRDDLMVAEMIAIPLTVLALVWVFGSLLAALLPLAVGIASIIGTMAVLRGVATLTDVSVYALNMTTAMGLALAIDYSLLMVSRYREEVRAGLSPQDAVRRTVSTAGRTVLFSAMTVALSLAALMVFPVYFLRSFAYAGIGVVALATAAALVLLPALLTLLGTRVDALDLRALVRRVLGRPPPADKPLEQHFWHRLARAVMRRAIPVGVLVTAVLVTLGAPFLHVKFGYPDERVLPHSASAHQVGDDLREHYRSNASSTITLVAPDVGGRLAATGDYAAALSRLEHVAAVASAAGTYADGQRVAAGEPGMAEGTATYLTVRTDTDPLSRDGKATLTAVEAVDAPWDVLAGGPTARNRDSLHALGAAMPYALGLIVLATFVLLFLFTGSVLLPLKALLLNTLSLSATFGAMVWIFQEGHFGRLFPDLTTTGYLAPSMPPLMFCLAFGLSMDYEVFLLSRIREAWLASGRTGDDNAHAVATGLGHTGRIITAAALLMSIVFASMAAGASVSFMMMFGTGLTLAVLMDATIVRGMLVPAFMRLAGRWNWWAPRPLARLHARIGLAEEPATPHPPRELVGV